MSHSPSVTYVSILFLHLCSNDNTHRRWSFNPCCIRKTHRWALCDKCSDDRPSKSSGQCDRHTIGDHSLRSLGPTCSIYKWETESHREKGTCLIFGHHERKPRPTKSPETAGSPSSPELSGAMLPWLSTVALAGGRMPMDSLGSFIQLSPHFFPLSPGAGAGREQTGPGAVRESSPESSAPRSTQPSHPEQDSAF